ncbi:MAG: lipid II flippase MurJ [Burkholderiaceae bacterium]
MKALRAKFQTVHADHRRIFKGAVRVALFLVLGKAAGALKEMAVAYRYGISDAVDAYQFTMTMATWLPVTIVGVLSVVLIPVLVKLRRAEAHDRVRFIRELQGAVALCAVALAALIWVGWPFVLDALGGGLNPVVRDMTGPLMTAFAPVAALMLIAGVAAARLRARERHVNTLLDSMPAVFTLCWVMLAGANPGVGPLAWGTLTGYLVQTLWLVWLAKRADFNLWGAPAWGMRSAHWPDLVRAAGIMLIGQVAMSFVGPIDQYTAANLGANANATLGYAARLLSLVLGIGAVSVGRAALPVLADVQARGDGARARTVALKWSVWMLGAGAVAVAVGWALAPWGVALLFERGAFTAADTAAVAEVFRWGLLQLPFYFGVLILVQLLASQNRYRIMATIAVANFGLKAVLNMALAPVMGTPGIMLATSCMYALSYVCYALVALRPAPVQPRKEPVT